MEPARTDNPPPPTDALREWERQAPLSRRLTARIGLQGKLILAFLYLLILALGASCWLFSEQSSVRVNDIMGEQARQVAYALSLTAKSSVELRDESELRAAAADLVKTRNILSVAFFAPDGAAIATASRDPSFPWSTLESLQTNPRGLMQVHRQRSAALGEYLAVVAPVLSAASADGKSRLTGYVGVALSQAREQSMLKQVNLLVLVVGVVMVLLSLPMSYGIVHRIFLPIRELVLAANEIAAGRLDAQVAVHRPDVIGTLARSFNEMARKVRGQQEALEAANADLERKVLDRTAQLETANKRLSSEIAEKEDFLRAVSHDLNAPLRNIAGMASTLLAKHKASFEADVVHRLERIQKNVQVETDLIAELLELSRIKTRRGRIEPVEVDALVRELGDLFENDLRAGAITFVIDNRLPVLACEKARLRQVFQNLVDNAVKYMGDAPTREVHVGSRSKLGETEFYVRDTGSGIDPDDLPRIFHVFRRGKGRAVQDVAGKGVGLASVKSIIDTYGGAIAVESRPGEGATFRFTLGPQPPVACARPVDLTGETYALQAR